MNTSLDMEAKVSVTFDLATLLLFQEVAGFAGFHDPILDHLSEQQKQVLWAGSDGLLLALHATGIGDWDAAQIAAERQWNSRNPSD